MARYLPYFAAALLFGLVSMWFQQPNFQGGIRAPYHGGSPLATCFTMLPVFCTYLLRLVWPVGLSAVYAPRIHTSIDIPVLVAGVVLVAVMYGGIRLWRADRRLGFWFVFFWLGLLPFAQIMPIDWLITDRYMNVSIIGAAALAGAGATALVNRFPRLPRLYIHALLVTGIAALAAVSFVRAGVWSDPVTLWSDAAAKSPESDKAWQELGESLNQAGRTEEARRAYERGLQVDPESQGNLAGLGYLLTNLGELDKGKACLDKLVRLRPDYAVAWGSLGWNYQKRGENEAAERMYRKSLELQPEAWTILIELGNLERQRGDLASARRHYEEAEARTGGKPESAYGLACVEARSAKPDTAFLWLEKALQRGYGATDTVYEETDLSTLWEDPRFGSLMRRYFTSASGEQQAR